jgi:quercetin dioxygenase-like cupin family protein
MLVRMDYRYIASLAGEMTVPADGILSRTLHDDDRLRVVLFGFSAGQELSEHTAKVPAVVHILEGEARLKLGEDTHDARAGAWAYMGPELAHGIYAKTPVLMLLLMLKQR